MLPGYFYFVSIICGFWFIAGFLFLLWSIGKYASRFNRSSGNWVLIAIIFSPIIAFLGLYMVGEDNEKIQETNTLQKELSFEEKEKVQKELEYQKEKKRREMIGLKAIFVAIFVLIVIIITLRCITSN